MLFANCDGSVFPASAVCIILMSGFVLASTLSLTVRLLASLVGTAILPVPAALTCLLCHKPIWSSSRGEILNFNKFNFLFYISHYYLMFSSF